MGSGHDHSHSHSHGAPARVLRVSLVVTAAYIVLLAWAGVRSHSLALLSEAGHNVSDFLALLLSLIAVYWQSRPPSATKTFGYQRAGVLAALFNASTLVALSFYIVYEAVQRLGAPVAVQPRLMMEVAAAGVVMNGVIALLLWKSSNDVNIRSSFIHMLGDTLSTAAVIVGGWAIAMTGKTWIDPALSIAIAAMILWSAFGIIRETLNILLEGTPRGMETDAIVAAIAQVEGVCGVHDLHVWSIGSQTHTLSCHVAVEDITLSASQQILQGINQRLQRDFRIGHTTIQFEFGACAAVDGCVMPEVEAHHSH